jgi:hypothetical protein
MTLFGGALRQLHFCVGIPDDSGRTVAKYAPPQVFDTAWLVVANATLGFSAEGAPMLHCHGAWRLPDGSVRGGHLLPERTLVGDAPVTVLVTALDGIELRLGFDEETRMPLMRPTIHRTAEPTDA